jgi:hypothetical protein
MLNPMRLKVVEIVGLHLGSQGRTCGIHPECGRSLTVTARVKFRLEKINITTEEDVWKPIEVVDPHPGVKRKGRPKAVLKEKVKELITRSEYAVI